MDPLDIQQIKNCLQNIELSAYKQTVLLEGIVEAIQDVVTLLVSIDNVLDKSEK